jgi:hypothetical protein
MNGDKADEPAKMIKTENSKMIMTIGINHHFFLSFKKSQKSLIKSNIACCCFYPFGRRKNKFFYRAFGILYW